MSGRRDPGLDAARGLAVLSMFVAHFAPSGGPVGVLNLSEHLTAFLFVLLIGCSAELGRSSPGRWRSSQIRAAVLIGLGLLLMQLTTGIVVVLVWLGVMSVLAGWISQLSGWAVAAVGVVTAALEPTMLTRTQDWLLTRPRDPLSAGAAELAFSGHDYRLMAFVLPACAGILLVRHARSDRARLIVAVACLPIAALLFALDQAGTIAVEAYTGTLQELVFNTAISVLAVTVSCLVVPRLGYVGFILAATGAMALTIYTLQVLGDWLYYRSADLPDDNQWRIMVGSCLAAVLFGVAWLPVARRTGWRGPLEAPVDWFVRRGRTPNATLAEPATTSA